MAEQEAARELVRLLTDPRLPHRRVWEQRGVAYRDRSLNHTSVAKVLASHLVEVGELDELEEADWPRARRDWVASRLSGRMLRHRELELFADAFAVGSAERERLRIQLESPPGSVTVPAHRPHSPHSPDPPHPPHRVARPPDLPPPGSYHSVRVTERHDIGAGGLPERHRTTQTIRSAVPDLRQYLYLFDADCVTVTVLEGGTAGPPRPFGDGLWGVVITLAAPVGLGETCDLVYDTTFAYEQAPPPEFRRGASADDTEITIEVRFHPDHPPHAVRQCTWRSVEDTQTLTASRVELRPDHSVAATYTAARVGLVGFEWSWE